MSFIFHITITWYSYTALLTCFYRPQFTKYFYSLEWGCCCYSTGRKRSHTYGCSKIIVTQLISSVWVISLDILCNHVAPGSKEGRSRLLEAAVLPASLSHCHASGFVQAREKGRWADTVLPKRQWELSDSFSSGFSYILLLIPSFLSLLYSQSQALASMIGVSKLNSAESKHLDKFFETQKSFQTISFCVLFLNIFIFSSMCVLSCQVWDIGYFSGKKNIGQMRNLLCL